MGNIEELLNLRIDSKNYSENRPFWLLKRGLRALSIETREAKRKQSSANT